MTHELNDQSDKGRGEALRAKLLVSPAGLLLITDGSSEQKAAWVQSAVEALREAAIALHAAEQRASKAEEWADIVARGTSPCGHWKAYAHTEDGGKCIACLQCELADAEQHAARLRAELQGLVAYTRHGQGCTVVCDFSDIYTMRRCEQGNLGCRTHHGPCSCGLQPLLSVLLGARETPAMKP